MTDDVAIIREALNTMAAKLRTEPREVYNPSLVANSALVALDRLVAWLEAAEADVGALSTSVEERIAERDRYKADAERLAEALRAYKKSREPSVIAYVDAALAAHEEER